MSQNLRAYLADELAFATLLLASLNLLGWNGLATAGLGMRVVGRSARALLSVVQLAPLGPTVLEPNLKQNQIL